MHCFGADRWHSIGRLPIDGTLDSPDSVILRQRMRRLGGNFVASRLIIPDSVVWYASCEIHGRGSDAIAEEVQDFLRSSSKFEISNLRVDWHVDGGFARIAFAENQNLKAAEEFASQHKFNPVEFAAIPADKCAFGRIAYFGLTEFAIRRGFYTDDRHNAVAQPEPATMRRSGGFSNRPKQETSRGPVNATGGVRTMAAGLLGFMLALLPAGGELSAGNIRPQPEISATTSDIRFAQLRVGEITVPRPRRRPVGAPTSGSAVGFDLTNQAMQFQTVSGGKFSSGTLSLAALAKGQPARTITENVLVDRGFDPYGDRFRVLEEFRVGKQDTAQAVLNAHVRNTVALIGTQPYAAPTGQVVEGRLTGVPRTEFPHSVGTATDSAVETALASLLEQHDRPQFQNTGAGNIRDPVSEFPEEFSVQLDQSPFGPIPAAPDEPAELAGATVASEFELAFPRPARRPGRAASEQTIENLIATALETGTTGNRPTGAADPITAELPVQQASLDLEQPSGRPNTAIGADVAAADEYKIAFSRPIRRRDATRTAPEPAAGTDIRAASLTTLPRQPAAPPTDSSNIVASLANETLEIDFSETRLIGIYGADNNNRRALVRLGTGLFQSVYRGGELNGGKVVEIRRDSVVYLLNGRRFILALAQ